MKKILIVALMIMTSSCVNKIGYNYIEGKKFGYITNFYREGFGYKSYEGVLSPIKFDETQNVFKFSIDNEIENDTLVRIIDSAYKNMLRVEIDYFIAKGKNFMNNRGQTNCFIKSCRVIDQTVDIDTNININVSLEDAKKMGWVK